MWGSVGDGQYLQVPPESVFEGRGRSDHELRNPEQLSRTCDTCGAAMATNDEVRRRVFNADNSPATEIIDLHRLRWL